MVITGIDMKRINNNSKVLAIANIQLDDQLIIHGLKLIQQSEDKRIVRFPSKKMEYNKLNDDKSGYDKVTGYSDIVHPCTQELRNYIEETLFKIYDGGKL